MHSIFSKAFCYGYWLQLRPYLFFISGISGLIGLSINPIEGWFRLFIAFVAFFLLFGFGQALIDVFQIARDSLVSPNKPLCREAISKTQVFAVSSVGLLFCVAIFSVLNPLTFWIGLAGVMGLVAYTWFEKRWWGGLFWKSWIAATLPVIGFLCFEPSYEKIFLSEKLWAAMGSIFFSYSVFVLLGYYKDISVNSRAGYNTFPVVFGWNAGLFISSCFLTLTFIFGFWLFVFKLMPAEFDPVFVLATVLWSSGIAFGAFAHRLMLRINRERLAHLAIIHAVRSFVLIHCGIVIALNPGLKWFILFFCLAFEYFIRARPEKSQI
ncbi:MAG: UbiA family prenyltransferase [Candidatus Riflebacteria bacterium]|nr:UbiA family prenyltransferase [Candidatus Riflebacteria bacterium]